MADEINTGADKTYTQAELDSILQSETDKRVTEALKKADRKTQEKIKEAEKLAKMNEEEKFQYQLQEKEKALADRERQLSLLEQKNEAVKILSEKKLPIEVMDFLVTEDAEKTMANITAFEKIFASAVKERIPSNTPKGTGETENGITKEAFSKMTVLEKQKLYNKDKDLFSRLSN